MKSRNSQVSLKGNGVQTETGQRHEEGHELDRFIFLGPKVLNELKILARLAASPRQESQA